MRKFGMALIATTLGLGLAGAASAESSYSSKDGLKVSEGESSLKISSIIQNRFEYIDNHRQNGLTETDTSGFRIRRFKTSFSGTTFSKAWGYKSTIAWQEVGSDKVEAAYLSYKASDDLSVFMGREKLPFNLEELTSSSAQTFVDRSVTNESFNEDKGNGIWINGKPKIGDAAMQYWLGLYDGVVSGSNRRNNDDNPHSIQSTDMDWSIVGRVQFHPFGDNGSAGKSMSDIRKDDKSGKLDMVIGTGFAYHMLSRADVGGLDGVAGAGAAGNADGTVFNWTVDAQVHYMGISATAAFFHQSINLDEEDYLVVTQAPSASTDMGFVCTVGYNMNLENGDQFEVAARYGMIDGDDDGNLSGRKDTWEGGIAFNYRLHGDKMKFSTDFNYEKQDNHGANAGVGLERFEIRFQAQFVF